MPEIEVYCTLDEVKRFLIESVARGKIPSKYLRDPRYLLERRTEKGRIYVEAEEKKDIEEINDIVIVEAKNVIGVSYTSKSGRTKLVWRQIYGSLGKITGNASGNALVNLLEAGIRSIRIVKKEEK